MEGYDKTSPQSIFEYSKNLIGKSLSEALTQMGRFIEDGDFYSGGKGGLGQLVEKYFFEFEPNSNPTADFEEAGVELKTTPLKKSENGLSIKERLVCDMIDFCAIVNQPFEESAFYKKCLMMLVLFYLHQNGVEKHNLQFIYSVLWKLQGKDLQIIKQDYDFIVEKIRLGRAHELSEGDTMYLGACRKGQKGDSLRKQPFNEIGAPRRAFALKATYMRTILEFAKNSKCAMVTNTIYSTPDIELVSAEELQKNTFEQIIVDRLLQYKGLDYRQIASSLGVTIKSSEKSKYNHATFSILHNRLTRAEEADEIRKAGIIVKNIRVQKNGRVKECMSFKNIDYKEICETESFYESEWYSLVTSKFLFVVYREESVPIEQIDEWSNEKRFVLDKVVFWTMPESDLKRAEDYWENIRMNVCADKHYIELGNTYWKISDKKDFHVRPKATTSKDMRKSPISGRMVRKVCYWFNNEYVQKILKRSYGQEWSIFIDDKRN